MRKKLNFDMAKKFMKFLHSIKRYKKKFGYQIAFRVFLHYFFRFSKNLFTQNSDRVKLKNFVLSTNVNDYGISKELKIFKIHEPINVNIISNLIKKNMICLDVGGNIGFYPLLESFLVGNNGKIIVVEPIPENFQYLEKNIKLNKIKNIDFFKIALGDVNGNIEFLLEDQKNTCWIPPKNYTISHEMKTQIIPIKIGDDFLDELKISHIDFIRMDAEGYELNIIYGLKKIIESSKPIISLELHRKILGNRTTDFFNFLKSNDYEIYSCIERDLDIPMIGRMKDVSIPSIDELINLINQNKIGNFIMLNLVTKNYKNSNFTKKF